jgi:hypothetical protein
VAEAQQKKPLTKEQKKVYALVGLLGALAIVSVLSFWPEEKKPPPQRAARDGRVRNSDLARRQAQQQEQTAGIAGQVAELPPVAFAAPGVTIARNIFAYPPPPPPPVVRKPVPDMPPPPTINVGSLSPTTAVAGTTRPITITVAGSAFQRDFQILWNGRALQTERVGDSILRATLSPSDIASPGSARVEVKSASQPDRLWSRQLQFQLSAPPDPAETFIYTGRIGGQAVIAFKDPTKRPKLASPGETIGGTVPWRVLAVTDKHVEMLDTRNEIRRTLPLAPKGSR